MSDRYSSGFHYPLGKAGSGARFPIALKQAGGHVC